jgi:hypothetical protein
VFRIRNAFDVDWPTGTLLRATEPLTPIRQRAEREFKSWPPSRLVKIDRAYRILRP